MMIAIRRLPLLLATGVLGPALLGACGAGTEPSTAEETAVTPTPPSSSSASPTPGQTPPTGVAGASVADLAATLDIDPAEVEVVSVEEVTWRDGSRGCAQPGQMYTQALIDGARITLRTGGQTYEYHAGGAQPPTRCDRPTE